MVEITIIEDTDELEKNNNDGWNELMGSDLVMKVRNMFNTSFEIAMVEGIWNLIVFLFISLWSNLREWY